MDAHITAHTVYGWPERNIGVSVVAPMPTLEDLGESREEVGNFSQPLRGFSRVVQHQFEHPEST